MVRFVVEIGEWVEAVDAYPAPLLVLLQRVLLAFVTAIEDNAVASRARSAPVGIGCACSFGCLCINFRTHVLVLVYIYPQCSVLSDMNTIYASRFVVCEVSTDVLHWETHRNAYQYTIISIVVRATCIY